MFGSDKIAVNSCLHGLSMRRALVPCSDECSMNHVLVTVQESRDIFQDFTRYYDAMC